MEHIEVQYNQNLKPLETVLAKVKRPGDFFVHGAIEVPLPKVVVKGAGTLSFPVPASQIASLVRLASRAPYGRGVETIVDTSVRNVWQIAAADVEISGKSWADNFAAILSNVTTGLGCGAAGIGAELYKFLVYESGGFFLAHRDTEKVTGMFGTLVLTLPSDYQGGELRIRHAGREITVPTNTAELSELTYCAFYADCEHEALPVTQGNRVCLVYNLIQQPAEGKRAKLPKAPQPEASIAKAAGILDGFLQDPAAPPKIAWLLEHHYSPAGLAFAALKGADLARARVLAEAAARVQCAVHLAIVHIGESGEAEPEYFGGSYRSRQNRYGRHEEDEDDFEDNGLDYDDDDFTPVEVYDTWQYVDEWRDTADRLVKFGRLPLTAGELLPEGALDEEPPDEKRFTEASGNEGATFERAYHRAALVLWRQDRTTDVLLQAGVVAVLPYLKKLAATGQGARQQASKVAERIVAAWPVVLQADDAYRRGASLDHRVPGPDDRLAMIELLIKLGAEPLLEQFLRGPVTSSYEGPETPAIVASVNLLGESKAAAILGTLISQRMPHRPHECAALLLALSENAALSPIAESAVAALDSIPIPHTTLRSLSWRFEASPPPDSKFVVNLLSALQRFSDGTQFCLAAAEKIAARPDAFSPVTVVVPAVKSLHKGAKAAADGVAHLWTSAAGFLLLRGEQPPHPPADWSLNVKLSHSCPDCKELQAFANDPVLQIHRFRVNKERRGHLHQMINRDRLDMTHVTERIGSPQTLVCTKDRRSFHERMKQYGDEIAAMRTLLKVPAQASGLSTRMEFAIQRASAVD